MGRVDISAKVREFHAILPKFPDGRINFSSSKSATVMTIFVMRRGRLLLLKRSGKVANYRGKWHIIGGYLDDLQPLRAKALEELREEIGVLEDSIEAIEFKEVYSYTDEAIGMNWITQIVVVELKSIPEIRLDWEHTECKWIEPGQLQDFDAVPYLDRILEKALSK